MKCCGFALDWCGCWNPRGREAEAREIPLHWTRYIHRTRHNRTVQKQPEEGFIDRVRNRSRGLISCGMAVWVCFSFFPSALWSISPGPYNILKPWGVDTYLNFTQARVSYFCCLNGKCVCWYQVQPSFSALEGIRWHFQIEECSWLPQTAAAWPQSLVWSIQGDVCPKLGWLVSSTATQRQTMSWRRWDFLIQWTDVLISFILNFDQILLNNWTQTKSNRKWRTDLTKRSIRAQELVEDSEGDTEHGGQS